MEQKLELSRSQYARAEKLADDIYKYEFIINALSLPNKEQALLNKGIGEDFHYVSGSASFWVYRHKSHFSPSGKAFSLPFGDIKHVLMRLANEKLSELKAEQEKLGIYVK